MFQTIALSFLAGLMGTNALPHLLKGMAGEEFPTVLGNSPLRNALAGVTGVVLTGLLAFWADMSSAPWAAAVSIAIGAYVMAAFHGLRGAFWLNTATGRSNPPSSASQGVRHTS
ncbi:hypothetical protein AGRA3207_005151 [Actinomadura graeca]|uniref:Uncharacterized protein n=1 Tax=Actinomadura graeca TaxID=2750812 RepID=A0ABX8QZ42_9ACTN|nr:hypothetical protein [Actinomadura graeca]QXJ23923.1 hypothetical protein AGRA3207_005151 [Actinomadura graeca]